MAKTSMIINGKVTEVEEVKNQIFVINFTEIFVPSNYEPLNKILVFKLNGFIKEKFDKMDFIERLSNKINKEGYKYYYPEDDNIEALSWDESILQAAKDVVNNYNHKSSDSNLSILEDVVIDEIGVFCSSY